MKRDKWEPKDEEERGTHEKICLPVERGPELEKSTRIVERFLLLVSGVKGEMSQEPQINSVTATNSLNSPQIQNPTQTSTPTTIITTGVEAITAAGISTAGPSVEIRTTNINRPLSNNSLTASPTKTMQIVKSQDVRVDNWGNYCLQRLQVMYDRGDFCDLILQFHNNQILKVHRVVVNLCTEYFANLERQYGLQDGMLVLPKDIEYSTMVTIVKFFYTGKLEVKGNQFNDIYRTVKLMNILILTKLLEAHARKPIALAKKEPSKPIVFKQAVEIGRPMQKIPVQQAIQQGTTIKLASPTGVTTKTITRSLPPGMKTKTVLARVQPQTIRVGNQILQGKLSTPKKLPIWKERKYAPVANSDPMMMDKWPPKDEPPRPTRFEWPDPEETNEDPYLTPANHALMEKQKAAASGIRKAEDIFDAVKNQTQGVKRSFSAPSKTESEQSGVLSGDESPASKVPKVLDSADAIQSSSHSINISLSPAEITADESSISDVNLTDETVEEVVSTSESFSQDSVDASMTESVSSIEEASLLDGTSISFVATEGEISTPSPSTSKKVEQVSTPTTTTAKRSAMKSPVSSGGHKIEKTVRFAPEVSEKENKSKAVAAPVVISKNSDMAASNHSRIISEVLKKYPDLVKENRNIKLKIVQKDSEPSSATVTVAGTAPATSSASKDPKSKVSYIVLKSTSAPDSGGSVVLKKPAGVVSKAFWDSDKSKKPPSGAENTAGPWLCSQCGTEEVPAEFESYYTYRRHLVDVHGERIDARICEYCGQKASKRNLLLYHLYTKHGVTPPKNCVFPHCDRCDYVALSESLLAKHKQGHDINKEFACTICNASFKSSSALQGHMAANLHRNKDTKVYECPYCRKPFVRNINLKAHIRSLHKDVARIEEMEDPRLPPDDSLTGRGVGIIQQGMKKRQFPSILGAARVPGTLVPENTEEVQHGMEGIVRSLVTADGQTIEILQGIDPSTLTVPVLVPSSEGGNVTLEAQHAQVGTEFVTGVNSDGTPAVFIMDSSQNAVQVDMSAMGVGMTEDGSMIFEGGDPNVGSDQFIVQDMQGNQFRKITGIDETGKQVIFLQLQDENGQVTMAPAILDDSVAQYEEGQGEGATHFNFEAGQTAFTVPNDHMYLDPQKCSVFVSSGGMTLPVTVSSDAVGGQTAQVLLSNLGASVPPGHVIEFHTAGGAADQNVVVTTANILNQVEQGQVQLHAVGPEHQHLIQDQGGVDGMGQHELHIVLGQNQVGGVEEPGKSVVEDESSEVPDQTKLENIERVADTVQGEVPEDVATELVSDDTPQPTDILADVKNQQEVALEQSAVEQQINGEAESAEYVASEVEPEHTASVSMPVVAPVETEPHDVKPIAEEPDVTEVAPVDSSVALAPETAVVSVPAPVELGVDTDIVPAQVVTEPPVPAAAEPLEADDVPPTGVPVVTAAEGQLVLVQDEVVPAETEGEFQESMQVEESVAEETEEVEMQEVMEVEDENPPGGEMEEVMLEETSEVQQQDNVVEVQEEPEPVTEEVGDLHISESNGQTHSTVDEQETQIIEEPAQSTQEETETQELVVEDAVVDVI